MAECFRRTACLAALRPANFAHRKFRARQATQSADRVGLSRFMHDDLFHAEERSEAGGLIRYMMRCRGRKFICNGFSMNGLASAVTRKRQIAASHIEDIEGTRQNVFELARYKTGS